MAEDQLSILEVAGTPEEIGRQTGEAWREAIAEHVERLRAYGAWRAAADSEFWKERLPNSLAVLEREAPALVEEMHGTAAGANLPLNTIAAINLPFYNNELVTEACSNVAIACGPDGPLWGKNNDGSIPGGELPIGLRVIRPASGMALAAFTFCGWLGFGDGMNEAGLAIGHASVGSKFQQSDAHLHVRQWAHLGLMSCRSTAEFVAHMASRPLRGKGYSWVAVDSGGDAVSLEVPCPLTQVRRGAHPAGHVHCVNIYQLPALAEADNRPHTNKCLAQQRREMLDSALAEPGEWDVARLTGLLRRHAFPAMCRHGGEDMSHTNYSAIAIPSQRKLLARLGKACEGEYLAIQL